ncbi:lectin-like protein [uncultured Mediterranean phage uvMED]|nr:lectin-like protein [uncultured Mediterranean phage uvMED]
MAQTYLTNTNPTAGNRTKGTISVWVKRGNLGGTQWIYTERSGSNDYAGIRFNSADRFGFFSYTGGNAQIDINTVELFRDTNAWYHIVASWDTTLGTASDRVKIYINGLRLTTFNGSPTYPSQDVEIQFGRGGSSYPIVIGRRGDNAEYFDGSMSHFHRVDNQALGQTVFGSTDSTTGEWKINASPSITYTGSSDFNFFILKDGNSVTDQSGQSNNLTVGYGTLTKTEDCPSNVFATFNPLDKSGGTVTTFSNGNTTTMHNSGNNGVVTASRSTLGYSSGKWYWEAKCIATGGDVRTGIISMSSTDYATNSNPFTLNEAYNYKQTGQKGSSGDTNVSYGASYTAGDIIGIAHDADNGTLAFYKNGVSQGNAFTSLSTSLTWGAFTTEYNTGKYDYNFGNGYFGTTAVSSAGTNASGNGIFEYDVPSGYTALSTKGLNL